MHKILTLIFLLTPVAAMAQDRYLVDWEEVGEESINHLIDLVRIDTSNTPGNETEAANYVKAALAADGIESEMFALVPTWSLASREMVRNGRY